MYTVMQAVHSLLYILAKIKFSEILNLGVFISCQL